MPTTVNIDHHNGSNQHTNFQFPGRKWKYTWSYKPHCSNNVL